MLRNRFARVLVVAALLASPMSAFADEPAATLVGLSITQPSPDGKGSSAVFARNAGLELNFVVKSEQDVIAVDTASCKLNAFADDKGTDLTKSKGFGEVPWLNTLFGGSQLKKGEARPPFAFAITSSVVPASGATSIKLDAVVGLIVATELTTDEVKDVALAVDSKVKLGTVDAIVSATGKSYDGKLSVTFTSKQRLDALQSIAFFDAAGTELKSASGGRSVMRMGDQADYSVTYVIPPGTEKATLKVTHYAKSSVVPVKIERTIGVGL